MTQHESPQDDHLQDLDPQDFSQVPAPHDHVIEYHRASEQGVDSDFAPIGIRLPKRRTAVFIGLAAAATTAVFLVSQNGGETVDITDGTSGTSGGNMPSSAPLTPAPGNTVQPTSTPEVDTVSENTGLRRAVIEKYDECAITDFTNTHSSERVEGSAEPVNTLSLQLAFSPNAQSAAIRAEHEGSGDIELPYATAYGASFASKEDTRGNHLDAKVTSDSADPTNVNLLVPAKPADGTIAVVYVENSAITTYDDDTSKRDDLCTGILKYSADNDKWTLENDESLLPEGIPPYLLQEIPGSK